MSLIPQKISRRILLISIMSLLPVIILLSVGGILVMQQNAYQSQKENLGDQIALTRTYQSNFSQQLQHIQRYDNSGDPAEITEFERLVDVQGYILQSLTENLQQQSASQGLIDQIGQISGQSAELNNNFQQLHKLRTQIVVIRTEISQTFENALRKVLAEISVEALNLDNQELAATLTTAERSYYEMRLAYESFLDIPSQDLAKDILKNMRKVRTVLKKVRQSAPRNLKKQIVAMEKNARQLEKKLKGFLDDYQHYQRHLKTTLPSLSQNMGDTLAKFMFQFEDDAEKISEVTAARFWQVALWTLAGTILLVGVAVLISFWVGYRLSNSLRSVAENMQFLSQGQLDIDLPENREKGELHDMHQALHVFQRNGLDKRNLEVTQANDRQKAADEAAAYLSQISDQFKTDVANILDEVVSGTQDIVVLTQSVQETAQATTQQSVSVMAATQTTESQLDQMAGRIHETSEGIRGIDETSTTSVSLIQDTRIHIDAAEEKVSDLENKMDQVVSILEFIEEIADKTNLLSLNATIEAARAGEAGKGFAVVASEVKALSQQTAEATTRIRGNLDLTLSVLREVIGAVQAGRDAFDKIQSHNQQVIENISLQSQSGQVMATQVADMTGQMKNCLSGLDMMTQQARQSESEMEKVMGLMQGVSDYATSLRQETAVFLDNLRKRQAE